MLTQALHFVLAPTRSAIDRFRAIIVRPEVRSFEWARSGLRGVPRYSERRVSVAGFDLLIPDAASFLSGYREIFIDEIYRFASPSDAPRILDVGANIGLSVLYFKSLFPKAEITAIEADPKIFGYLKRNLAANGAADVVTHNVAAWDSPGELRFATEGADAGRVVGQEYQGNVARVPAVNLAEFLRGSRFDFIKIDIEGAESRVLPAIGDLLGRADFVFVEYHSDPATPQELDKVIGALTSAGLRLRIDSVAFPRHPLVDCGRANGFDAQLNIFCRRTRPATESRGVVR